MNKRASLNRRMIGYFPFLKSYKLILFFFIFFLKSALGQNLVPNPSFENLNSSLCDIFMTSNDFNTAISDWTLASQGTADLFSTTAASSCFASTSSTHSSSMGKQTPRTGNVTAGIITYAKIGTAVNDLREYLQVKLTEPLIVGKTYEVEFWVSNGEGRPLATNNIGAFFSDQQINQASREFINVTPQINETNIVTEKDGWQKISGTYTATSASEYLILGNFFSNANTQTSKDLPTQLAYYFIDDVSVVKVTKEPCEANLFGVFTGLQNICEGDTGLFEVRFFGTPPYTMFYQLNGVQQPSITVNDNGPYFMPMTVGFFKIDSVSDAHCMDAKTLGGSGVNAILPLPEINLGEDETVCSDGSSSLTLDAGNAGTTFLWNTTETTQTINVSSAGNYTVEVTDAKGCTSKDTITITETDCNCDDNDNDGICDEDDLYDYNDGILDTDEYGNCPGSQIFEELFFEDFGTGNRTSTTYTNYCYEPGDGTGCNSNKNVNDGEYAIVQFAHPFNINTGAADWAWDDGSDHTGNANGRMMVVNASSNASEEFYRRWVNIIPNVPITVDLWIKTLNSTNTLPNVKVSLEDENGNPIGSSLNTGDIPRGAWQNYQISLNPGNTDQVQIILSNNNSSTGGNDLALDDIRVTQYFCDDDNDGIANYLDLDSDDDGCPDAMEGNGGFTESDLANQVLSGNVDANGIPIAANGGQADVSSTDNSVIAQACGCDDNDDDGICDEDDLDDDNDGILDSLECVDALTSLLFSDNFTGTPGDEVPQNWTALHPSNSSQILTNNGFVDLMGTKPISHDSKDGSIFFKARVGERFTPWVGGMKRTISGFTIGKEYYISFEQSIGDDMIVPGQGHWSVELGNEKLNSPTISPPVLNGSTDNNSEFETVEIGPFIATASSLELSFDAKYIGGESAVLFLDDIKIHEKTESSCDYDNDGIINSLDLDSDNDGCPDAIEGDAQFTFDDLENDILRSSVDNNGIPIISNGGQQVGTSLDSNIVSQVCDSSVIHFEQDTFYVCLGDSVEINAINITNESWGGDDDFEQINDSLIKVSPSSSAYYFIKDNLGQSHKDSTLVIVYNIPTLDLGLDLSICDGDSVKVSTTVAGDYLWSNGLDTSSIFLTDSGAVWLTLTDSNGCKNTDTINVEIITQPVVDLGNDTAICTGDSIQLDAKNSGLNFVWNTGVTSQSIWVRNAGIYGVEVSTTSGCSGSDSIEITINDLPQFSLGNDTTICAGDSMEIGSALAGDYLWSNGPTTSHISVLDSGMYWLTITDANRCENSDSIFIGTSLPPSVSLGSDTAICAGDSIQLDAQNSGLNFVWSTGSTNQNIWVKNAGVYEVQVATTLGCSSSSSINVTVIDLPIVNLGPDTTICEGQNITLDAQNIGANYVWNNGETNQSIQITEIGIHSVEVRDNMGCLGTDSILISKELLEDPFLEKQKQICEGDSIVLEPEFISDYDIYWESDVNSSSITVSEKGTYLSIVEGSYCKDTFEIKVNKLDTPTVIITDFYGKGAYCFDYETAVIQLSNDSIDVVFIWDDFGRGDEVEITQPGTYYFTTENENCASLNYVTIEEYCEGKVYIPNAFTPGNGDGKNDVFKAEVNGEIDSYELKIYNRWGELIYLTNNINDGWDGTYKGNPVKMDVYVYNLSYSYQSKSGGLEQHQKIGQISLIK